MLTPSRRRPLRQVRLPVAVRDGVRTLVRAGYTARAVVEYVTDQMRYLRLHYYGYYEAIRYVYDTVSRIYNHELVQRWFRGEPSPPHQNLMDVAEDDPGPVDLVDRPPERPRIRSDNPLAEYFRRRRTARPTRPPSTPVPALPAPPVTENPHSGNLSRDVAMSHFTSFPVTRCCVDLGAFHPKMKKDFVDPESVVDTKTFKYHVNGFLNSTQGNFSFLPLLDSKTSITDANPLPGTTLNWNQDPFPGLNSVRQLEAVATSFSLTHPTTQADQDELFTDPGDSNQLVLMANQYIECYIKNINVTAGSGNESPAFVKLYLAQAKNDIYDLIPANTTNENVGQRIRNGWLQGYTSFAGGSTGDIDMFYHLSENPWIFENFNIIDSKKFCLALGQEGVFRSLLKPPQILSMQHWLRAKYRTTGYTDPVICKKGEMMFFYQLHGGVATYDSRATVNIAPAKVAFVAFASWNASLYASNKNISVCTEVKEVADGTAEGTEVDILSNS